MDIYVITLKNKQDYIKSKNFKNLYKITNKLYFIKGIILNEKQSKQYYFYSKSAIGISLAHFKIWKKIQKKNINNHFSLILEDDTILNVNLDDFFKEINDIINKHIFDIYKIHSDFNNGFTSCAAYIINNNSINKLLENYKIILGHIDFDLFVLNLLNKIKILIHPYNLFYTDESESLNRKNKYSILKLVDNIKLSNRCDKSLNHLLSYKVFRIINYELIVFEIFMLVILIFLFVFNLKYLFLIILILLLI